MKTVYLVLIGIAVVGLICMGVVVGMYNSLVTLDVNVNMQWSEVENQYHRRYELIPNVVEATKDYMDYEEDVLVRVTEARTAWYKAFTEGDIQGEINAGADMGTLANNIIVQVEAYPELHASAIVQDLITELEGTANRVAVARGRFIESVADYNVAVRSFPTNIFAMMFGFREKPNYQAPVEALDNPDVNLRGD